MDFSSIINPESYPRGDGFCFLICTNYIVNEYVMVLLVCVPVCVWMILNELTESRMCLWFSKGWCMESAPNWPKAIKQLQKIQLDLWLDSVRGSCHIKSPQSARFDSVDYKG